MQLIMMYITFLTTLPSFISAQLISSDVAKNFLESNLTRRHARSWGGDKASIKDFPFLVNLEFYLTSGCGGSILSPYFVITAAHCVHDANGNKVDLNHCRVRAGSSFRNRGGSVHYVSNMTVFPNYTRSAENVFNDLALLKLLNPIQMDNSIKRSISMIESDQYIKTGSRAVSAGWGCINENTDFRPEQLQSLKMKTIDKNSCKNIYQNTTPLNEDEICASAFSRDNVTRGMCLGDSGGPLVIGRKLVGIVKSGGSTYDSKIWPNKFTEISRYRNWIDEAVDCTLNVSEPTYDQSINKIDDVRQNISRTIDYQKKVMKELYGDYGNNITLEDFFQYCYDPMFVEYQVNFNHLLSGSTNLLVNETKEKLQSTLGKFIDQNCSIILEKQRTDLTKKLYSHLCKETTRKLISDSERLVSLLQDSLEVDEKIKYCLGNDHAHYDGFCDKKEIEKMVKKIDRPIQSLLNVTKIMINFVVEKNQSYLNSLVHETIYIPVQKCMESHSEILNYGYKIDA